MAGKNASSELNATCAESPIASSARNDWNERLTTESHSRGDRRQGLLGGWPISVRGPCGPGSASLAPIPPARKKPAPSAPAATIGEVRAQLGGDVRRLAEPVPQLLDRLGELAALALDLAAQRVGRAPVQASVVAIRLQRFGRQLRLADGLFGDGRRCALDPALGKQAEQRRDGEEAQGHDQERQPGVEHDRERDGRGREEEAEPVERDDGRADAEPDAGPEQAGLLLQLQPGELELELRERAGVLGDLLGRGADARAARSQRRGWAWLLQSINFASRLPTANATPATTKGLGPAPFAVARVLRAVRRSRPARRRRSGLRHRRKVAGFGSRQTFR